MAPWMIEKLQDWKQLTSLSRVPGEAKGRNSLNYEITHRGHRSKGGVSGCCVPLVTVHSRGRAQDPGAGEAGHTAGACRKPGIPKRQENTLLLQWLSSALYWQSSALCQLAKEKYRAQQSRQLTIDLKLRGHKLITSTLWSPYGDPSRRRASRQVRRYLRREDQRK